MERNRFSSSDRKEPWEQVETASSEQRKAPAKKLRLTQTVLTLAASFCLALGMRGPDFTATEWLAAVLVHCLFALPANWLTLWSFRLRPQGRFITLLARTVAILSALFWFLTAIFSFNGPEPNTPMALWCFLASAANLIPFAFSFRDKTSENEM